MTFTKRRWEEGRELKIARPQKRFNTEGHRDRKHRVHREEQKEEGAGQETRWRH